mgnify:FL=1
MLTAEQLQVFESVARNHPRFREYLASELEQKSQFLIQVTDGEQFRVAQGHARCLQTLIKNLDDASKARR